MNIVLGIIKKLEMIYSICKNVLRSYVNAMSWMQKRQRRRTAVAEEQERRWGMWRRSLLSSTALLLLQALTSSLSARAEPLQDEEACVSTSKGSYIGDTGHCCG
jgi:hypothetical protein